MKIQTIALVAHDNCKKDLIEWVKFNRGTLEKYRLVCTGTTGRLVQEALDGNGRKEVRLPGKRRLKNLADGTVLPAVDRLSLDMRHGETVIYQMNPPAASGL